MSATAISAKRLGVRFRRPDHSTVNALNDIDFTIPQGEFTAIIGSSGAGKTTLLRTLTGFVRPTGGELIVDGTSVSSASRQELYALRRRAATIYQHFNLVERVTAIDNVLHGRLGHTSTLRGLLGLYSAQDRTMAWQMLLGLGLGDRALHRVDQLSGGERQRVAIARALVQEPSIVLADEPAASLDIALARQVNETLHELHRHHGITVIVNMHNLEMARTFATRIIGLRRGQKVFDGSTEQLNDEMVEAIYDRSGLADESYDPDPSRSAPELVPANSTT